MQALKSRIGKFDNKTKARNIRIAKDKEEENINIDDMSLKVSNAMQCAIMTNNICYAELCLLLLHSFSNDCFIWEINWQSKNKSYKLF